MSNPSWILVGACFSGAFVTGEISAKATETPKQRCVQAYENGQSFKRKGQLTEARSELLLCASSACPEVMHADCQSWLSAVEASTPTVVFRVKTLSGSTAEAATASVDGGASVILDGRAMSVDPGRHRVTFAAAGLMTATETFDFSEGEKLRREIIVLQEISSGPAERDETGGAVTGAEPGPEPHSRSGFRLTLPVTLAASATAIGIIGVTYFGLTARAGERDLNGCSPNCSRERVDSVKRDYLFANVSLGVAAAGVVTTSLVLLLQGSPRRTTQSARVAVGAYPNQLDMSIVGSF